MGWAAGTMSGTMLHPWSWSTSPAKRNAQPQRQQLPPFSIVTKIAFIGRLAFLFDLPKTGYGCYARRFMPSAIVAGIMNVSTWCPLTAGVVLSR